jgi:hypothetical protein
MFMKRKKRNGVILLLLAIGILATWYFMQGGYCEVVYSQDPHTQKLVVSCDETHCTKTCYLKFRKKGSEDPWNTPGDSHKFDTSLYEYRCTCK